MPLHVLHVKSFILRSVCVWYAMIYYYYYFFKYECQSLPTLSMPYWKWFPVYLLMLSCLFHLQLLFFFFFTAAGFSLLMFHSIRTCMWDRNRLAPSLQASVWIQWCCWVCCDLELKISDHQQCLKADPRSTLNLSQWLSAPPSPWLTWATWQRKSRRRSCQF